MIPLRRMREGFGLAWQIWDLQTSSPGISAQETLGRSMASQARRVFLNCVGYGLVAQLQIANMPMAFVKRLVFKPTTY